MELNLSKIVRGELFLHHTRVGEEGKKCRPRHQSEEEREPIERKGRIIQPARATANVLEAYLVQRARLLGGSPKEIARAQGWRVKKHGAPDRYSWVTRDNLIQIIWEEGAA